MAKCDYCGTTILFGGVRAGDLRFCNETCHQNGYVLEVSQQIPHDIVLKQTRELHQGLCPKCQGNGPVDVYTSYKIHSFFLFTSWKSIPNICCRSCGTKSQLGNTAYSLVLGWWGFPWGFIITPIQLIRNIVGMFNSPDPLKPSDKLENIVRITIAEQALNDQKQNPALL